MTYTSFDCLSLPIPSLGLFTTLSLDCILEKFTQKEVVHGVECVECTKRLSPAPSPSPTEGMTRGVGDGDNKGSPRGKERIKQVFLKQMTISKVCCLKSVGLN